MQTLPVFLCENCDYHSEKIGETRAHAKTEHGIDYYKPYKCTHCEYTSDWFPKFCHHVKRHIMPQSVICNMCGKVLKSEHRSSSLHVFTNFFHQILIVLFFYKVEKIVIKNRKRHFAAAL